MQDGLQPRCHTQNMAKMGGVSDIAAAVAVPHGLTSKFLSCETQITIFFKMLFSSWAVVTHTFSPSPREEEAGGSMTYCLCLPSASVPSAGTSGWKSDARKRKTLSHLKKSRCGVTVGCRLVPLLSHSLTGTSNSSSIKLVGELRL